MSHLWGGEHCTSNCQIGSILRDLHRLSTRHYQGDRTKQLYKTLSTQQECRKQMRKRVEKGVRRYLQRSFRMRTLLWHSSRRLWLGAGAHKCALQHAKRGQGGQQHKESRRTSRTKHDQTMPFSGKAQLSWPNGRSAKNELQQLTRASWHCLLDLSIPVGSFLMTARSLYKWYRVPHTSPKMRSVCWQGASHAV